jgi:peptidyl-prolyl cis-trans isomerase A (cyclophilin A)
LKIMRNRFFLSALLGLIATSALAQNAASSPPAATVSPAIAPKQYATVRVVLTTSLGPITLLLEKERAPITAANFLRYVDQKRYDGISFYRRSHAPGDLSVGFIQGGTTDPKRVLPPIAHEPTTKTGLSHSDGALSAPRFAPGTARGDFTIIVGSAPWMDANPTAPGDNLGFAVFGRVVEGMDVVRGILAAPTSPTKGVGAMKGEMLDPAIRIVSARRAK